MRIAIWLVLLTALTASCERDSTDDRGAGLLAGTRWRLIEWVDESLDPTRYNITADFSAGEISGSSGVNSYGGSYTAAADGRFGVGELRSTLMAGPPDAMRAEAHYLRLLREANAFSVTGDRLILRSGRRQLLVFAPR